MEHVPALRLAFDLVDFPSQARVVRGEPLPRDVSVLLRIAVGEPDAIQQAVQASGRSTAAVREAASFFIEQILLFQEADSYRVLGAKCDADAGELRRNMALLLQWLHPDHGGKTPQSVFATRVTRAWNDLKTSDRRAAYDQTMQRALLEKSLRRKKGHAPGQKTKRRHHVNGYGAPRASTRQLPRRRSQPPGLFRWLVTMIFGGTFT